MIYLSGRAHAGENIGEVLKRREPNLPPAAIATIRCGGQVEVVSCIEDPEVIKKSLQHLALKESAPLPRVNEVKGPPFQTSML